MSDRLAEVPTCTPSETLDATDEITDIDEIDAAVDAISDDEIEEKLNGLLARVVNGHPCDAEQAGPSPISLLARRKADHAIELESLLEAVQAAVRELRAVQSQVIAAKARRDALNRAANMAQMRLIQAHRQLAEAAPGAAAYLDAVSTRSHEILDAAHSTAQDIIDAAETRAKVIRACSDLKDGQLTHLGGATFSDRNDR